MEFGRVPENKLAQVDFTLPDEPQWNANLLKGQTKGLPKIYLGSATWGRKEWIGKIYPKGTKDGQLLDEYIRHYNAVELNATHYKLYDAGAIQKWADKAGGDDFLFCPKVYQGISHSGSLHDKQFLTDTFLAGIAGFGAHLGPVLLQLSDKFGPKRKEELYGYLDRLPKDLSFFLEVRYSEWFEGENFKELLEVLTASKIGLVITDTAGRRDCCHMHLTGTKAFIRYVGNGLHPTDYTRIDDWVKRIKTWLENGLAELYFFIHLHEEAFSPELTGYLVDQLNAACGLDLKKPVHVQLPLFP